MASSATVSYCSCSSSSCQWIHVPPSSIQCLHEHVTHSLPAPPYPQDRVASPLLFLLFNRFVITARNNVSFHGLCSKWSHRKIFQIKLIYQKETKATMKQQGILSNYQWLTMFILNKNVKFIKYSNNEIKINALPEQHSKYYQKSKLSISKLFLN